MGAPFARPRHPEDLQIRPMSYTFEDTTLRSMQTADSPLAYLGHNPALDLSLLSSRTSGPSRVGKPSTNPFGSERKYKSPFADDPGSDTFGLQYLNMKSDAPDLKPSPPTYGGAATPGVMQTGSVTTRHVGSQQYMIQRDHSQMTQPGQQPSVQQQALLREQMIQRMRQQQRQSGRQTRMNSNPKSQAQQVQRPHDTSFDAGIYSCTYHGCFLRFDSPAKLQRHKREGHRQVSPNNTASVSASPNLEPRNSGEYKMEQVYMAMLTSVPGYREPLYQQTLQSVLSDQQFGYDQHQGLQDTTWTRAAEKPIGLMNVHYTLSEDRCGDQNSVMVQRLAALGARHRQNVSSEHPGTFSNPGDRGLGSPAGENEKGPQWMNRLTRISSQSKSMSRTDSFDEVDGKMAGTPPGQEPPVGRLPKPALRRRKEANAFTDFYDGQNFNIDFSTLDNTDVFEKFGFDSFLNTSTDVFEKFDFDSFLNTSTDVLENFDFDSFFNTSTDDVSIEMQIFAGLESQEPLAGWQTVVKAIERTSHVKALVDSYRLVRPSVELPENLEIALQFERQCLSGTLNKREYLRELKQGLGNVPPFMRQMQQPPMMMARRKIQNTQNQPQMIRNQNSFQAPQTPQQNAQLKLEQARKLSTEDNIAINLRAADLAKTTPKDKMRQIVDRMAPQLRHNLQQRGIDPIIYYFRMMAAKDFRRSEAMKGGGVTRMPNE